MWDWDKNEDDDNRGGAVTDEDLSDFLAPDLDLDDPSDRAEYEERLENWFDK